MYWYAYTIASHCSFMEYHLCLIYSYTQLVLANCDMFLYTFVNCDLSYVSNVYRKESVIMCQQRICTHLWSVLLCQYVFIQPCELVIFYSADLIVEGSANISHLCVPCWSWLLKYAVCTRPIFFGWIVEVCSLYSAHFFSYARLREHSLCHAMTFSTVQVWSYQDYYQAFKLNM